MPRFGTTKESRTTGFDLLVFFLFEALRMVREDEVGVERRVRHIALLCGSRNRGMGVVGGMVYYEAPRWSSVVLSHSSDQTFKILICTATCRSKTAQRIRFRNLPYLWLLVVQFPMFGF